MLFHSLLFVFIFLPLVVFADSLSYGKRWRTAFLIVASYVFYGWAQPVFIVFLLLSSLVDFQIGRRIARTSVGSRRKLLLGCSLIFNLGLLAFFKFQHPVTSLISDSILGLSSLVGGASPELKSFLKANVVVSQKDAFMPPGISFYTFQTLSYTFDIYRRRISNTEPYPFDAYLAFVSFFPQLIAGPIERARDLLPQIMRASRKTSVRKIEYGLFMIAFGLFKKMVVADNLGVVFETFAPKLGQSPGTFLILQVGFAFQIYCDFSAYSDIARGSGLLLGVKLSRNFLTPYFARNPSEFWTRWHISLSAWLRDYLYISIGGNRYGIPRTLLNLMITMTLGGLWHGPTFNFVLWGIYHGALLVVYRILPIDRAIVATFTKLRMAVVGNVVAGAFFFVLNLGAWSLFFHPLASVRLQVRNFIMTAQEPAALLNNALTVDAMFYIAFLILPIVITDILGRIRGREFTDLYLTMKTPTKVVVYLGIALSIILLGTRVAYDFIYFQF